MVETSEPRRPPPEKVLRVPEAERREPKSQEQLDLEAKITELIADLDKRRNKYGIRVSEATYLSSKYDELVDLKNSLVNAVTPDELSAATVSYETVAKAVDRYVSGGLPWPFDAFMDAFKDFVKLLGDAIQAIWRGFVDVVSAVFSWLKKNVLDPLLRIVQGFLEQAGAMISSAMGVVLTAVTTMVHPSSPLSPDMALPMFGVMAASVLGISAGITAINATHPLKDIIGSQQVAFIYKFLGFEHFSSAFWGSLGGEILDHPMRLWARMTFRARVPNHMDADEMLWHGQITPAKWHELHTYEGWSDEYIRAHFASQWRNPSVREIGMITDAVGLEPAKIEEMLQELGYNPEDLPLLTQVLARRPTVDELKALRSLLITDTVEGGMTIGELESALRGLGTTDGELTLLRQIVALRTARAQRLQVDKDLKAFQTERVKALTQAYERDLMDDGQYLEELLAASVEPLKASQTLYLEQVKKVPRPKRVYESVNV